jgi:hypothetical protein
MMAEARATWGVPPPRASGAPKSAVLLNLDSFEIADQADPCLELGLLDRQRATESGGCGFRGRGPGERAFGLLEGFAGG